MSDDRTSAKTIRFPKGARWECRGCAACCSGGFDLGPVEPEVIAALTARGIEQRWPPAAAAPWAYERPQPDGQSAWFLRQDQGRCVFLREDLRCAVHVELGPSFKPGFCREFPYHLVHDLRGVTAILRPDCGGWHDSLFDGPEISEDDVREVLAVPRAAPRRVFSPSSVSVLGVSLPLETWLDAEQRAILSLESLSEPDVPALLTALRSAISAIADVDLPPPDAARAEAALVAIFGLLASVLRQVSAQPGPPDRVRFAVQMAERLSHAESALRSSRPIPEPSRELCSYLGMQVRSALMARTWQPHGAVEAGLGALLLGIAFAQIASDGTLKTFDVAYRDWVKLAGNQVIAMVLSRARGALIELFLHLER